MKFINYKKENKKNGFTIIEMIIAISVFSLVITVGMGALLNAYKIHKKSNSMRSVMDNINFIMDDMSRTIRVGSDYSCDEFIAHQDCFPSKGDTLSLKDQYGRTVVYKIGNNITKDVTGLGTGFLSDTSIFIDLTKSGFKVIGADPTNDSIQPLVIIMLSGSVKTAQGDEAPFSIQTSVSQRTLDIPGAIVMTGGSGNGGTSLPSNATFFASEYSSGTVSSLGGTMYYAANNMYYGNPVSVAGGQSFYCNPISFATSSVASGACYFVANGGSGLSLPSGAYEISNDNTAFSVPSLGGIVYYVSGGLYYGNPIDTLGNRSFTCESNVFSTETISGAKCYFLSNKITGDSKLPKGAYLVSEDNSAFSVPADGTVYYSSNDYYYGNPVSASAKRMFDCNSGSFGTETIKGAACYLLETISSGSPDYVDRLPVDAKECTGGVCSYKQDSTLYYGTPSDSYYALSVTGPGATDCLYSNFYLRSEIKGALCYISATGSGSPVFGIPKDASLCVYQDGWCNYDFSKMDSGGTAYYGDSSSDYSLQISNSGTFPCTYDFFKGKQVKGAWCAVAPNGPGCYIAFDQSGAPTDPICN